jgi:predicted transcriptional regulator YdeE
MAAAGSRIGPLWQSFMNGGADSIPEALDAASTYSVYTGYETDHTGAYDVILGRRVHDPSEAPAGMRGISIPAGRYLLFRAAGRSVPDIQAAWRGVYDYFAGDSAPRRAFTYDFEKHSSDGVEVYIAVR